MRAVPGAASPLSRAWRNAVAVAVRLRGPAIARLGHVYTEDEPAPVTTAPALAACEEHLNGRIAPGYRADLTAFAASPLHTPAADRRPYPSP